jgi:hypothetical protein
MFKKLSLIITLTLLCQFAFGQTEIYGTWDVHCGMEQSNKKSLLFCGLCKAAVSDTMVGVKGFTMTVDTTHIQFGESKDRVSYIKRPSGKAITFVKDKTPYNFTIVATTSTDHVILRSSDGTMLLLQRQKEEE